MTDGDFELREHTADVALYAWGNTADALFAAAARGLYAAMGELVLGDEAEPIELSLEAPDLADLLGDFLGELLYLFDTRRVQVSELDILELAETRLRAGGRLRPVDMARSAFDLEIKAVTRHDLAIRSEAHPFETTVVLDI